MTDTGDRGAEAPEAEPSEEDEAAQAFAALCAEVGLLRRLVEALSEAVEGMRAPDYGPTLGALAQGLGRLETGLAAIAGHPALALTPQQHARALGDGAAAILRTAAAGLRAETEALGAERKALAALVGRAAERGRQRRVRLWFGAGGLGLGLALFPLLGASLPGGSYLAALATGTSDRWQAGSALLQAGNPAGAAALAAAAHLSGANAEALQGCAEAARRAGAVQRCLVSVPVPER